MTDKPKTFDLDGHSVVLVPERDKIDGVEKLKTMDCDEIDALLFDAVTDLNCSGQFLMSNCLMDVVFPIMMERERAQHRWVLASEVPDDDSQTYFGRPSKLTGQPTVDPSELELLPLINEYAVKMKRVRIT